MSIWVLSGIVFLIIIYIVMLVMLFGLMMAAKLGDKMNELAYRRKLKSERRDI